MLSVLVSVVISLGCAAVGLALAGPLAGRPGVDIAKNAGTVAYLLLWASTVSGLLVSSRLGRGSLRPADVTAAHRFLSQTALGFAAFHALMFLAGRETPSLGRMLVPFAWPEHPLVIAAGQVAFPLLLVLVVSFYLRSRIGARAWRSLHYAAFGAYALALVHGLSASHDAALYLATAAVVFYLVVVRLMGASAPRPMPSGRRTG
jgi:hypothetical protein